MTITRPSLIFAAIWVACPFAIARADTTADTPRLAGSDLLTWIVVESAERDEDTRQPLLYILFARHSITAPLASPRWREFPTLLGDVRAATATRDHLWLLFSNNSLLRVADSGKLSGPDLPRGAVLQAWAGDPTGEALYAVVSSPSESDAGASHESCRLLRLHGGDWQPIADVPPDAAAADTLALAVRKDEVLLFWSGGASPGIHVASWAGEWRPAEAVAAESTATRIWAGWRREGAVLLASEAAEAPDRANLRTYLRGEGAWSDAGLVREDKSAMTFAPSTLDAIVANGRLAVARRTQSGIDVGLAGVGPESTVSWNRPDSSAPRFSRWSAWISHAAMFGLLFFVFVLRSDRLSAPPEVPAHLRIALPAWRLLATLIDLLPACLLTAYWWLAPLATLATELVHLEPAEQRPYIEEAIWWPSMLTVAVYALYCLAWEILSGTTPGKHLLGCRVVNDQGQRPKLWQLVVRNLMRIPELASSIIVVTLFVMLIASPRRQRIGDLLAGTLVVAHTLPTAEPVRDTPRESGSGADRDH